MVVEAACVKAPNLSEYASAVRRQQTNIPVHPTLYAQTPSRSAPNPKKNNSKKLDLSDVFSDVSPDQ